MPTLKLGSTTAMTESSGTITLDSGINGTQFKSSTPVAGDIVQYRFKAVAAGSNETSSSSTNTVAGCAKSIISDVIDTGSTTSTIWKVTSYMGLNLSGQSNSAASCKHWYSIDGGTSYSQFVTSGSFADNGNYIVYDQGSNGYFPLIREDYMVIGTSESNVKFAAAFYSWEGESIRWNNSSGAAPPNLTCIQIKI